MIDKIQMKGRLRIYMQISGIWQLIIDDWNLVVDGGREAIAMLMDTGNTGIYVPSYLGVGDDDGTLLPLDVTNTDLGNVVGSKYALSSVDYESPRSIKFTGGIPNNELGGVVLKEAGLFCYDNPDYTLFARKIHNAYTKVQGTAMSYIWTIMF